MDLESAVRAAAEGDLEAFAEITRRFQHMAFGYALSFVRDLGHAEDVVQEAFVAAWYALPSLADVCRGILDGEDDDVPTAAFYFTGGLDEILARAARQ